MFTERNAIEDEYRDIKNQMDALWARRTELRLRLREIDERDFKEQSVSYDALNSLTDKLTEVIGRLSDIIPPVEVRQVIDHISKDVNKEQIIVQPEEKSISQNELSSKIQEEVKKEKAYSAPKEKISRERTVSVIKEILIDHGGPMKARDIEKEFYKRTNGRKYSNFYEQIKFASKQFPKIKKADRGTYIYENPMNQENINQDKERPILHTV